MAIPVSVRNLLRDQRILPVVFLVTLVVLYIFSSRLIEKSPRIESITPEVGEPGKVLVISGEHFGDARNGSEVIFAGSRPNSQSYVEWTDTRISVQIPEDVNSGRLVVRRDNEASNTVLFTSTNDIPKLLSGPAAPGMPYIESLDPANTAIGSVVTIRGLNFGSDQGVGKVYFASTMAQTADDAEPAAVGIQCSSADFDYESWVDTEVSVRVPDGATSGSIRLVTDRGVSNALYFEVSDMIGDRLLPNKRGYQVNYTVEVENVNASPDNALNLWIPNVIGGSSQTNLDAVRDPAPLWENYNGVARYRLTDVEPWRRYTISITYWLDRTALETRITPAKVSSDYDRDWKLYKVFTSPDSIVSSADPEIIRLAERTVGREKNPYYKARALYRMMIKDFAPRRTGNADASAFIESRQGDSFDYNRLYTALLRAVHVPARVIAGSYIFNDGSTTFHYWAEYYLHGFGWIPVDVFMGDLGHEVDEELEDPEEYYFGSVDNRRILFSRGIVEIKPTDPKSMVRVKDRVYSLQTIHEEAVGNIEDYESRWYPLRVIDRW